MRPTPPRRWSLLALSLPLSLLAACGSQHLGRDLFPSLAGNRDRRAELGLGTIGHEDLEEHAVVVGAQLHQRLVGLDLGQDVAVLEGVALLDDPARDRAALHRVGQAGHHEFVGHQASTNPQSASSRRAAAPILSSWASAASSRFLA